MRKARLKADASDPVAYYHCISRVVERRFALGELEREHFIGLMRGYEALCGVRVVTFCVLSNHFHLLVEVPRRPDQMPGDNELVQRVEMAGDSLEAATLKQNLERRKGARLFAVRKGGGKGARLFVNFF